MNSLIRGIQGLCNREGTIGFAEGAKKLLSAESKCRKRVDLK